MDSLEIQLRRCTRSWQAWLGAAGASVALFAGVAATSIIPERLAPPELPLMVLSRAPASTMPAELPPKPRPLASSDFAKAFKFDPTTMSEEPEIPIGLLDTSAFGGSLKFFNANASAGFDAEGGGAPSLAMTLGMLRTFEVQKPENPDRYVIFERDQVDEIPVWLYGPQPNIPTKFDRADWTVLVLYSVSERGRTENIYILDTNNPELAAPVKAAIAEWKFRPARKSGKAVRVWVQQPVNYHPESKSPFSL